MYLDCFYQYVVVPILPGPDKGTEGDCDDEKACLPAAAAGSLSRYTVETGRVKVQSEPSIHDSKVDSDDSQEIPAAAGPSIPGNASCRKESVSSDRTLIAQGNKVPEPIDTVPRSAPNDPSSLTQLLEEKTLQPEINWAKATPELWVGEREIRLGDGVYRWVFWKDGTGVIRTRVGKRGNESLRLYREWRWPRRVQRWMAFSFNKCAGQKPWERTRFIDVLSGIENYDIYEKSQATISEAECAQIPAKTKTFWGARTNRDCTVLRVETIEALKMYCRQDFDGFMNMVHRYKTVITNDLCENITPGPIFTAGMVKDTMQRLAATSWAGLVPDETINYVRRILHHHLANRT